MTTDYIIWQELEKMRREEQTVGPIALELPAPMPYWEEPRAEAEVSDDKPQRGVVIINMNDYDEEEE